MTDEQNVDAVAAPEGEVAPEAETVAADQSVDAAPAEASTEEVQG